MQPSRVLFQQHLPVHAFLDTHGVNQRLLQLSMKTGFDCIQKNGQRHYGPPPNWVGSPPERGSEVFIGRLPRDCFEDELVPLCESVAPIYTIRMMMNFTGFNRGFAFVSFCNAQDAWRAVTMLNETEIRPGRKIGVSKSLDNCRLYIGGIPTDKTRADAWEELGNIVASIKDIILYTHPDDRSKNRGFFFAEFDCHRSAAMAKRQMAPGTIKLWNHDVIVDWADPEPDVDPTIMATVSKLFIRNLNSRADNDYLKRVLLEVVPAQSIHRIYIAGHYAFIHIDTRSNAQIAKEQLECLVIDGEEVEVQWARPRCYKKQITISGNCRSVPPRLRKLSNGNNYSQHNEMKPVIPYIPVYQHSVPFYAC